MSLLQKFKQNLSAQFCVNSNFMQKVVFNKINIVQNQRKLHLYFDMHVISR